MFYQNNGGSNWDRTQMPSDLISENPIDFSATPARTLFTQQHNAYGTDGSSFSRRYDGMPLPELKECYHSFTLHTLKDTWFENVTINRAVRKRTAIAKKFHIFAHTECVDLLTNQTKCHIITLWTDREHIKILSDDNFQNRNYWKHMPEIAAFPGVARKTINELIASQIAAAASYKLMLYPHHGFIPQPDGSFYFVSATETKQIPAEICPESVKMRKLENLTSVPNKEAVISLWTSLFCSSPKLKLLGLIMIASLLLYFCEEQKISPDFLLMIRPSEGVNMEQIKAALYLLDDQQHPIPDLEIRDNKITDYLSKIWDAVALFLDNSFADEGGKIENALRTLAKRVNSVPNGAANGRTIISVISRNASYTARKITESNILFISLDNVKMTANSNLIHLAAKAMEGLVVSTVLSNPSEIREFFTRKALELKNEEAGLPDSDTTCHSAVKIFIIAAQFLEEFLGIQTLSEPEFQHLFRDLATQKDLILDADQKIVMDFARVLSENFRTGAITMTKKRQFTQIDPNGCTVIVDGNRMFMSGNLLNALAAQMTTVHNPQI